MARREPGAAFDFREAIAALYLEGPIRGGVIKRALKCGLRGSDFADAIGAVALRLWEKLADYREPGPGLFWRVVEQGLADYARRQIRYERAHDLRGSADDVNKLGDPIGPPAVVEASDVLRGTLKKIRGRWIYTLGRRRYTLTARVRKDAEREALRIAAGT